MNKDCTGTANIYNVYSHWECPECDSTADFTFADMYDVGNPICGDCDLEMELTKEVTIIPPIKETE